MKLYTVVGSPNCRKVEAVIGRLGLEVQRLYHDFFTGDLQQPGFAALNVNCMVPVLDDDGFLLSESNAINQYLCDKAGADDLFPREPRQRAEIVKWLSWELAHFNRAYGGLAWETIAKPNFGLGTTEPVLVAQATENLKRFAPVLDGHLKGRDTVNGRGVTIADYAIVHLEMFKDMVPFDWSPYPNLNRYFDAMRKDPHWAHTAPPSMEAIGRRPKAA